MKTIEVDPIVEPGTGRKAQLLAGGLAPGALGQFIPPGPRVSGPLGYVPGFATGAYSTMDALGQMLDSATNGYGFRMPGGDAARDAYEGSIATARETLPEWMQSRPDPNNPEEVKWGNVSEAMGSVAAPMSAFRFGPQALRTTMNLIMPGSPKPWIAAPVVGGTSLAIQDALDPSATEAAPEARSTTDVEITRVGSTPQVTPSQGVPSQAGAAVEVEIVRGGSSGGGGAPTDVRAKVDHYADKHLVPRELAHSIIAQESNYNPRAVNKTSGAKGLGQLMDDTARELGVTDPFDPDQNLDASMRYLRQGMDREGTVEGTARYYYGGPSKEQWGRNTEQYAQTIGGRYRAATEKQYAQGPTQTATDATLAGRVIEVDPEVGDKWPISATAIGLGAAAALIGGPTLFRAARNAVRMSKEAIYTRAAGQYNADLAARVGTGQAIDEAMPQAPVPGVTHGSQLAGHIIDANAPTFKLIEAIADTPDAARKMRADWGLTNNHVALDVQIGRVLEEGYDRTFGFSLPSNVRHTNAVNRLTPDERSLYNQGRAALDEIDNRENVFDSVRRTQGRIPHEIETRMELHDDDTAHLRSTAAHALGHPVVGPLLKERKPFHDRLIDLGTLYGYHTQSEATRIKKLHKAFLARTDVDGKIVHTFGDRPLRPWSGLESATTDAAAVDKQHAYELIKLYKKNKVLDNLVAMVEHWQTQNPKAAKLLTEHRGPGGDFISDTSRGNVIMVRRGGEPRFYKVHNKDMMFLLDADVGAHGAFLTSLNMAKGALQSLTTGPWSALVGAPFGPVQFVRSAFTTSIARPKGMATSPLDLGVQRLTGGRVGLPGDVVGTAASMAYRMGADATARGAKFMAAVLDPTNPNKLNRVLRTMYGDAAVDGFAARAMYAFDNSITAERQRLGAYSSGGYGTQEVPTNYKKGGLTPSFVDNVFSRIRRQFNPQNALEEHKLSSTPFVRQGQWLALRTNDVLQEIHHLFSEAASSNVYALNRKHYARQGRSAEELAYDVRDILGDPGKKGSGRGVRTASDIIPYGNIALQDAARLGRALSENPAGTVMGMTVALGSAAALSLFTAIAHGPDAIRHYMEEVSNPQSVANVMVYPPAGTPVDQVTEFSLSQRERPFYAFMKSLMHDLFAVPRLMEDQSYREWVMGALGSLFEKHITTRDAGAMLSGASSMVSPPIPGPVNASFNLAGKQMKPDIVESMFSPNSAASSDTEKLFMDTKGGELQAPNTVAKADSVMGSVDATIWKNVLASIFGLTGAFMARMWDVTGDTFNRGGSGWDVMTQAVDIWQQNFKDKLGMANNVLWQNEDRLNRGTPLSQLVSMKLHAMRPMGTALGDVKNPEQTRSLGPLLDVPNIEKVPTDPVMRQMWFVGSGMFKAIQNNYMPRLHDIEKQMTANERSGMSQALIRSTHNELVRKRQAELVPIATMIERTEQALSDIAGVPVQVERIDWSKGPEQFR